MSSESTTDEPPGQAPVDGEHAGARPDECRDRADRQVDVARDDDHHHADRENQDVPVLHDEVRDVLRAQQDAVGQHREQRDDRDQRDEDAVLAEVGQDMAEPVRELVLGRVDVGADGGAGVGLSDMCVVSWRRVSAASPWSSA